MKEKRIPLRMCVSCKKMMPKNELLRIVRTPDGDYKLDTVGKVAGRGAYICDDPACIELCNRKKLLNKVFSADIPAEIYQKIGEEYAKYKQD